MLFLVFKHYLKEISLNKMIKVAVVAAIYAVLTMGLAPISYGPVQFRVSELMVLLAFIDPLYVPGLVLGCVIANFTSPLGIVDIFFGSFATTISLFMITKSKNLIVASLWPAIFNGIILGLEFNILTNAPLLATTLYVAFGEFVVVTIIGCTIMKLMMNNKHIVDQLKL
ncbi:QueT transporter family protein [Clostridium sp. MSJ-4]|uniref:QueT transporter family protein n=1 Tax=Clostridium simiarum TaxID=2841506 RepID=A0ABS6F5Q8_9CLOT|nr:MULTISPECIES: QueT transporter family protein [Clostridium]MBU5592837.1 QueT transporter family protein [Clostridium simiarum]